MKRISEMNISRFIEYIDIIIGLKNVNFNEHFDLIYATSDCISDVIIATSLKKKFKIKLISILHHQVQHPLIRKGNFISNNYSFFIQKYTNYILKKYSDVVLFYKTLEGFNFARQFSNKKYFVYNGIDELVQDSSIINKTEISFIGGLRFSKGIGDLLKVAIGMKAHNTPLCINIYGGGSKKNIDYIKYNILKFKIQKIYRNQRPQRKVRNF